ncbi:hypothetical protein AAW51_1508 [Caldimonas brevitalea]|uniref:AB hydrolase-1 domain-containing protein n=2 Tax=Caldimonas brevitalea TaxID=413882 RepID=A0A0G3BFH3_9BURK|nr:hypothetical protein AAW51_1508 [Caldimonas brevitalea]
MRAAFEFAASHFARHDEFPGGDGHPVIVFPGLAADIGALGPLCRFCANLGYDARDWGRGVNTGPQGGLDDWLDDLCDDVLAHVRRTGRKVSLVGWSLGGIYAREVAKKIPKAVRQVITLGSPFAGDDRSDAGWLWHLLSVEPALGKPLLRERLRRAPPVPTTSIYSRTDGVVAWQCCIEPEAPQCESIEISDASHIGLIWNTKVWRVVADRLSQPEHRWRPYSTRPEREADFALDADGLG